MTTNSVQSNAHCLVVYDDSTKELGRWVVGICKQRLPHLLSHVGDHLTDEANFYQIATSEDGKLRSAMSPEQTTTSVTVVVVAFFDGLSDGAKTVFAQFKTWAAERKTNLVVQALNAKKGSHTLMDNEDALISSIVKKLPGGGGALTTAAAKKTTAPSASDDGVLIQEETIEVDVTAEALSRRLRLGQGECFWTVAGTEETLPAAIQLLRNVVKELSSEMFPVTSEPRPLPKSRLPASTSGAVGGGSGVVLAQEFMVRTHRELEHIEMRLAMCGNVDSGKSTITSVLTRGIRDDGRGHARAFVFNHKHEQDTGRTSSVSENHLGFDAAGNVMNYDGKSVAATVVAATTAAAAAKHTDPNNSAEENTTTTTIAKQAHISHISTHDLAMRSDKVITLYDLAGHEKYLKTTVLGMTRSMPDYACIVVSANNGIQRMTKEHLGLCLALKLPFFVVVTRIDSTPDNVRQETSQTILKLLKMPTVKKLPFPVRKTDDVIVAAKNLMYDRITPIFEVSNVTGQGIADVLQFLNLLPCRKDWASLVTMPREMIIDSTFFVTGVGTVVGGIITQGRFKTGDTVWLGPDGLGAFRTTQIKSIHVKGVETDHVDAGNDAALCLKKEKRSAVRKGNVLLEMSDAKRMPSSYWQFEAEIVILYHSTTISTNYEPVIHSTTVRQSARIMLVEQEVLRTGDRSTVRFHFLYRPEFMQVGQRMIFREGRTKGIGTVTKLIEVSDDTFLGNARSKAKEVVRATHQPR
ncbi:GTP-binding elongation factor TU fragment, putative [Bodo saltans]|uniref:GTP-binding elongation factor TU, putative n=1 Tax=Bodo saltans TaxID=75058 RepID=A0A0S4JM58_BODSA|nr:GTP-binding elongation factor TU fragment, putative [Bodo saltans]